MEFQLKHKTLINMFFLYYFIKFRIFLFFVKKQNERTTNVDILLFNIYMFLHFCGVYKKYKNLDFSYFILNSDGKGCRS